MKQYGLTAALLIRDENEYLPEWLAWNAAQGVEHFYLYDDSRESSVADVLGDYAPMCTVRDAKRYQYHLQFETYIDALRRFGHETEWMAFIDTDEFLRSVDETPVTGILDSMPDNAAAVLCPWVVYNANGQMAKTSAAVRERFTQPVEWPLSNPNWKSIVRPALVQTMAAHSPIRISDGAVLVDAHGVKVEDKYDLPADKLVVDHYYTKSYEEWVERLAKGSCDPFANRKNEWFVQLNPDLAEAVATYEAELDRKENPTNEESVS